MCPLRNVLIHAINAAIREGALDPDLPSMGTQYRKSGYLHIVIDARPAIVLWPIVLSDEMLFVVWWDYIHSKHPQANGPGSYEQFTTVMPCAKQTHYRKFLGGIVSGWFDRERNFLKGIGADGILGEKMRRGTRAALRILPTAEPLGYGAEG